MDDGGEAASVHGSAYAYVRASRGGRHPAEQVTSPYRSAAFLDRQRRHQLQAPVFHGRAHSAPADLAHVLCHLPAVLPLNDHFYRHILAAWPVALRKRPPHDGQRWGTPPRAFSAS